MRVTTDRDSRSHHPGNQETCHATARKNGGNSDENREMGAQRSREQADYAGCRTLFEEADPDRRLRWNSNRVGFNDGKEILTTATVKTLAFLLQIQGPRVFLLDTAFDGFLHGAAPSAIFDVFHAIEQKSHADQFGMVSGDSVLDHPCEIGDMA